MSLNVPRLLRATKSGEQWTHAIFIDTETTKHAVSKTEHVHTLRLGWACVVNLTNREEQWYEYRNPEAFLSILERVNSRDSKIVIISHNLAFDLLTLRLHRLLHRADWDLTHIFSGQHHATLMLSLQRKKSRLTLLDSQNYFQNSVEEIGKSLGMPKGRVDFEDVTDSELSAYCRRDVEIIKEAVLQLWNMVEQEQFGRIKQTLASQAFSAFRNRFMRHKILLHRHEEVLALERAAFTGARTECYFLGPVIGQIYHCDVNSMYPFVMREREYPTKLLAYYTEGVRIEDALQLKDECFFIAEVDLHTVRPRFPVKSEKGLTWPTGHFTAVLCHESLMDAFEKNEVTQLHSLAVYKKAPIFREYINFFWERRRAAQERGDGVQDLLNKRFMNCLNGKFGQREYKMRVTGECDPEEFDSLLCLDGEQVVIFWKLMGREIEIRRTGGEGWNSFPAISAAVVDYAMSYLWQIIELCGWENVYYCDTDCVFTNKIGLDHLRVIMGSGLGEVRLVKEGKRVIIRGKKDYSWDGEETIKGIPRRHNYDEATGIYTYEQWDRLPSALAQGHSDGIHVRQVAHTVRRGR